MSALQPGFVLGRYRIEQMLGRGGMGDVYRAEDTLLRRRVALKVLRPDGTPASGGDEARRRILREARAAAAFEHPNVVAIYDMGEDSGLAYIAMQYLEGTSLRAYVGNPTPTLDQRVAWLTGIARALAAAHRAGLVHRDIKPDNVMVCADGVKVLDFGIAKLAPDAPASSMIYSTQPGQWVGTPLYMAPEQRMGHADARSDQYAWGVVAYELLGGKLPTIPGAPLLPLAQVAPVPPGLAQIVGRALSQDPSARFASMDEVLATLGAAPSIAPPAMPHPTGNAPTPLSAYSTVQHGAHGALPPTHPQPSYAPPPMHSPTAYAPTMASAPAKKGAGGLVVALLVAALGLVALGGAGAAAFVLWGSTSASSSASATDAQAPVATGAGTGGVAVVPADASTPLTTPTSTQTSRVRPTSDAGSSTIASDAGAPAADAGARADAGAKGGPASWSATVIATSAAFPFADMNARGHAMQPGILRCANSFLTSDSPITGMSATSFVNSFDGSVQRTTVNARDKSGASVPVPDAMQSCVSGIFGSQVFPKGQAAIVQYSVILGQR